MTHFTHTAFPAFRMAVFACLLALAACGGEENTAATTDTLPDNDTAQTASAENVFYYIPSPIEMADLLRRAGAGYDKDLPNLPDNVSRYTSTTSQALNLGIYGADVSFSGIMGQTAETMTFMSCANKLAEGLHVSSAFPPALRDRLETNMGSRDSVLNIITNAYWDCDALLHENNQQHASALMIAGGWIEGLYLACRVAEKTNNNEIRIRIAEQRFSLDKLIDLLNSRKHNDLTALANELKELQAIYAKLPPPAATTAKEENGITVIGAEDDVKPVSLNALEFKAIFDKVKAIREKIVTRT
ncbi:MAG: hypothetical protein MUC87_19195 [Bacteroidia bacterium]|jgi:hypothetical protein|nr:hypothetical protein [Bacteroidia bacterium]